MNEVKKHPNPEYLLELAKLESFIRKSIRRKHKACRKKS